MVREFAVNEVRPISPIIDKESKFPEENLDLPTEDFKPSLASRCNGYKPHPENSLQFRNLNKPEYSLILYGR